MSASVTFNIRSAKIVNYLLDLNHPIGGPKAKFFLGHGFDPNDPGVLASSLLRQGTLGWPGIIVVGQYGRKHEIVGTITTPNQTTPRVLSVWQEDASGTMASFVTAYPQ